MITNQKNLLNFIENQELFENSFEPQNFMKLEKWFCSNISNIEDKDKKIFKIISNAFKIIEKQKNEMKEKEVLTEPLPVDLEKKTHCKKK